MKKIIRNPRKGVTLVELVIALSVISIITIAAISMLHTSIKIEVKSAAIIEANNTVESIVEAFDYSDDADEFLEILKELNNKWEFSPGIPEESQVPQYVLNQGTYIITIDYTDNKIEINAIYSDGQKIYENITYFKGM